MTRSGDWPTIAALKKIPRKREWLLRLSDGNLVKVMEDDVARFSLAEGVEVTEELARDLASRYEYGRARALAVRLLKVRPRTEGELRLRLRAGGIGPAAAEPLLADLKRDGLVNDRLFSRLWAGEKMRLGATGRRRVVAELRSKHVDPGTAEAETDGVYSAEEEIEAAKQLAVRRAAKMGRIAPDVMKRRLYQHLVRRGFESDVAAEATHYALRSSGEKGTE
ncbi:MAG: RecX family transcriptional regulator [bacterium]